MEETKKYGALLQISMRILKGFYIILYVAYLLVVAIMNDFNIRMIHLGMRKSIASTFRTLFNQFKAEIF